MPQTNPTIDEFIDVLNKSELYRRLPPVDALVIKQVALYPNSSTAAALYQIFLDEQKMMNHIDDVYGDILKKAQDELQVTLYKIKYNKK